MTRPAPAAASATSAIAAAATVLCFGPAVLDDYQQAPMLLALLRQARPNARIDEAVPLVNAIAERHGGITYQCAMGVLRGLALGSPGRMAERAATY